MCLKPWYHTAYKSTIPCGGCIGCRLDKLSLWSARASSELSKGRNSFVTFTYDRFHLPVVDGKSLATLERDVAHKYLDKIRHQVKSLSVLPYRCRTDYKYYLCGEYGDNFERPHYHALFFGLDFMDFNNFFSITWHCGSVKSLPVSQGSIKYVLKYLTKSINGSYAVELYDNFGRERPFSFVSKKFGYDFFASRADEINCIGGVELCGRFVPIPSYYRNLFCSFDESSVQSRLLYHRDLYAKRIDYVKSIGFESLADYQSYTRSVMAKSGSSTMRADGLALDSHYMYTDCVDISDTLFDNFI